MTTSNNRYTLYIPVNPVPASRPRVSKWGTYYGKNYNQWRKDVDAFFSEFIEKAKDNGVAQPPCFSTPVIIALAHIVQKAKTSKRDWPRGDLDNYDKAALDAIVKHGFIKDDDLVLQLHSYKAYPTEGQGIGTRITITKL